MRKAALDQLFGVASLASLAVVIGSSVGCGASPAYAPKSPATVAVPANDVVVVPADRVVEKCPCDGESGAPGAPQAQPEKNVQYVHVTEWQSPAAAKRAEAYVAENPSRFRASTPPPALTMHQGIPETRVYRMGRTGFGRW